MDDPLRPQARVNSKAMVRRPLSSQRFPIFPRNHRGSESTPTPTRRAGLTFCAARACPVECSYVLSKLTPFRRRLCRLHLCPKVLEPQIAARGIQHYNQAYNHM